MKPKDSSRSELVALLIFLPFGTAIWVWWAFATSILWGWFISAEFGLPNLSLVQAMGIGMVVATFKTSLASKMEVRRLLNPDEGFAERMIGLSVEGVTQPLFALGFGWVVKQFM